MWLNWAEIGRTESKPHGKQCHIVSRTCTLRVCVCLWLVSRAIGFSTEWKGEAESAVGGVCCCAVVRDLYIKRDGWVSCSLTKHSRRLIGGAGAQTIPEDSLSAKKRHVTTVAYKDSGLILVYTLLSLTHFLSENAQGSPRDWDRLRSTGEAGAKRVISKAFVSWGRRHSCPHAGEGKPDTSQPLLPFTFSKLSSPPEDPSTGFSHAPENHEVQPFLPYRFLRGSGYV